MSQDLNIDAHLGDTNRRDAGGTVMPWFTWPALDVLDKMDIRGKELFEWGTGFGTLWFISRGAIVNSRDHDKRWVQAIGSRALEEYEETGCVRHVEAPNDEVSWDVWHPYPQALRDMCERTGGDMDIIVVDGVMRVACTVLAALHIAKDGLIIIDNSDRPEFALVDQLYKAMGMQEERFDQPNREVPWRTTFWRRP